jgi:hypothetical protein
LKDRRAHISSARLERPASSVWNDCSTIDPAIKTPSLQTRQSSIKLTTVAEDQDYAASVVAESATSAVETLSCGIVGDAS